MAKKKTASAIVVPEILELAEPEEISEPEASSPLEAVIELLARNAQTGLLVERLIITVDADVQVATQRKSDGYIDKITSANTLEEALAQAAAKIKTLKGWV